MLYLLMFLWVGTLLSACNSNPVRTIDNKILSIIVSSGSGGSIAPQYRSSRRIEIQNNLNVYFITKNNKGVTKKQDGKITQAQFENLIMSLKTIDLAKIKSKSLPELKLGSGHSETSIKTNKGVYRYKQNGRYAYPPAIATLYGKIRKL